ncbi:MAG: ecotin family protein [Pseudomonadales bacterium]
MNVRIPAALLLLLPLIALGREADPLDAFPPPQDGTTRYVIQLPALDGDEAAFRVELVAGRVMSTDGVNQMRMDTAFETRNLEGWGYAYYEMTGSGRTISTRMAPAEGAAGVERFVGGSPVIVRYSSRLPIVAYVPDGFEVQYRVWAAADNFIVAHPG